MAEIIACRVCFATDVKLYNIYKYHLNNEFENLTGISISAADIYPKYLCTFCTHLLVKSNRFKVKCLKTQEVLRNTSTDVLQLTAEHILSLPILESPVHSLSISHPHLYLTVDSIITAIGDVKDLKKEQSDQSDDEPLAKKVKKKKYPKFVFDDDNIEESINIFTEFENDNFDNQNPFPGIEFDNDGFKAEPFKIGIDGARFSMSTDQMELILLSKEEQIQDVLKRKESRNYLNSFYKCELCFKGFITEVTFKNHMVRHDVSSGPLTCDVCHCRLPDLRSLKAHVTTTHERKYVCKQCCHTTRSLHTAREHIKWHNGHVFNCKMCGATFAKSTSYLTHLRLHHPSEFTCDNCGESFISQNGLNIHKKKSHNIQKTNKKSLKCTLCNVKFKNTEAFKHHNSVSANGKCVISQSPCTECGENFSSEDSLKEHQESLHKHGTVKCDECDRSFAHERSFTVHYQRVHLGVKLKHKREQPRKSISCVCEICGKKCISKATLVCHQRTHSGEKPYQCTECPKKFSVCQRLQIHLRTHTGERPFKCPHCPKAFKHKAALNRHVRVHTGVKPYQCPHCPKKFSQSNSMKLHVRTVHLKMPAPYRNKRTKVCSPPSHPLLQGV